MPVVPDVCVMSAGWSGGMSTGRTRGVPARARSSTAPGWLPEVSNTFAVSANTSSGSSPVILAASVTRCGCSARRTSSATVAPSSFGDSSTGTAPIRAAASASRVMSNPSDL
jgi:hypothetical protein